MKKIAFFMTIILLLGLCACTQAPTPTDPSDATPAQTTETPTETPTEAPTQPAGPQVTDMVGAWQRTFTEVEGDRTENTKATITIEGASRDTLTITYKDKEFPDDNFKEKALTVKEGEIYPDCGNDSWYAQVASTGKVAYFVTLLEDGTLMLQCSFDFDGQPMVSYQWFARSE